MIPNKYRCETCGNKDCDLSNENLERAKTEYILSIGRRLLMRSTTEIYGCASHSAFINAKSAGSVSSERLK
jgi:hypothetical protein